MKRLFVVLWLALAYSAAAFPQAIKVGVIAPFSGPFADYGRQFEAGIKAYQKLNGDSVAGHKIEVVVRDTGGPSPEVAKRLAQELVVRDKVDFLAGFGLTPEALAVADVATQAKKPMVIFNAATSIITTKSPYIVRTSMTLPQISAPMGTWAAKNGIKKVSTLVADYGPGNDAESSFKKAFTAGGGQVVDSIRTPLQNPDFAPFIQRIKDAKPDAVFIFVPAGEQSVAVMKAYNERGLAQAGIKAIATGDVTDDHVLNAMGDAAIGMITTFHYSAAHDSPENKAFLKAYADVAPNGGRQTSWPSAPLMGWPQSTRLCVGSTDRSTPIRRWRFSRISRRKAHAAPSRSTPRRATSYRQYTCARSRRRTTSCGTWSSTSSRM